MPQLESLFMEDQIILTSTGVWLTFNIITTVLRQYDTSDMRLVKNDSVGGRGYYNNER